MFFAFLHSKMLYLRHATALMQLYNPNSDLSFFHLVLPFCVFTVGVHCCGDCFLWQRKTSAKDDFLYFWDNDGFVGRILEIRF